MSVREVYNDLEGKGNRPHLQDWLKVNRSIFLTPTNEETAFVREIFSIHHFQYLVTQKQRLKGTPVADPFVIASAKLRKGCVVTEEEKKDHAARMPNVCDHFGIKWANL